jgi:methylated-DNA-[protein]-cysteine S-methyltransferase
LRRYADGENVRFDLGLLALDACGYFQREVLLSEYAIPRGAVSTYGRVARVVGHRGAARAVGQALARNPFPVVIPCHRAVRADGSLGGYRGGVRMKRALLELEGVEVDPRGRVCVDQFYY